VSKKHGALAGLTLLGSLVIGVVAWRGGQPAIAEAATGTAAIVQAETDAPIYVPPVDDPVPAAKRTESLVKNAPDISPVASVTTEPSKKAEPKSDRPAMTIMPIPAAMRDPRLGEVNISLDESLKNDPDAPEIQVASSADAAALAQLTTQSASGNKQVDCNDINYAIGVDPATPSEPA